MYNSTNPLLRHRPVYYKQYHHDEHQFKKAVKQIEAGMSVHRAALEYGLPKSTLHDRASGKVGFDCSSGPQRYLSDKEETDLIAFLDTCSSLGYGCSRSDILAIVQQVVNKKKGMKPTTVSYGWWDSFKR